MVLNGFVVCLICVHGMTFAVDGLVLRFSFFFSLFFFFFFHLLPQVMHVSYLLAYHSHFELTVVLWTTSRRFAIQLHSWYLSNLHCTNGTGTVLNSNLFIGVCKWLNCIVACGLPMHCMNGISSRQTTVPILMSLENQINILV